MAILLVTTSYDLAADYVTAVLDERGADYFRLDTDQFPQNVRVTLDSARGPTLMNHVSSISGKDVTAVWYRRHTSPVLPDGLEPGEADFCQRESRALLMGVLHGLTVRRWMSHPSALSVAELKPYQLIVARRLGFRVPPTVMTNDPIIAKQFTARGPVVAKAVSSGYIATVDGNRAIFTSRVSRKDLQHLDELCLSPVTFQQFVRKRVDIRVTVVDGEVYPAEIFSQTRGSSRTDWRATDDPNLRHARHRLPRRLSDRCAALLRALGLTFGAIDLALDDDGTYTFFEINPNGEWLWIEDQLGYPIASSIAEWLSGGR